MKSKIIGPKTVRIDDPLEVVTSSHTFVPPGTIGTVESFYMGGLVLRINHPYEDATMHVRTNERLLWFRYTDLCKPTAKTDGKNKT